MSGTTGSLIKVRHNLYLDVYYDRPSRVWVAFYVNEKRFQLAPCWYGPTRDDVLIHREPEPTSTERNLFDELENL